MGKQCPSTLQIETKANFNGTSLHKVALSSIVVALNEGKNGNPSTRVFTIIRVVKWTIVLLTTSKCPSLWGKGCGHV